MLTIACGDFPVGTPTLVRFQFYRALHRIWLMTPTGPCSATRWPKWQVGPGNSIIDAFKTCNTTYRLVAPLRLPIYNVGETLLDKSSWFAHFVATMVLIVFAFLYKIGGGVSQFYERSWPSRRAGQLATSIGPRYWSPFAKANLAIDCQVVFIGRPLERSLSTQISWVYQFGSISGFGREWEWGGTFR